MVIIGCYGCVGEDKINYLPLAAGSFSENIVFLNVFVINCIPGYSGNCFFGSVYNYGYLLSNYACNCREWLINSGCFTVFVIEAISVRGNSLHCIGVFNLCINVNVCKGVCFSGDLVGRNCADFNPLCLCAEAFVNNIFFSEFNRSECDVYTSTVIVENGLQLKVNSPERVVGIGGGCAVFESNLTFFICFYCVGIGVSGENSLVCKLCDLLVAILQHSNHNAFIIGS